jgi:hypothetical protein
VGQALLLFYKGSISKKKKTPHKSTIFLAMIIPIENGSTQVFNLLNYNLLIFK